MTLTRDDIASRLDALEAALPGLIAQCPDPADFWSAFASQADRIEEDAGDHAAYVVERTAAMLARHGRYIAFTGLPPA